MRDIWEFSKINYRNNKKIYRILSFSIGMSIFMILSFVGLIDGANQMAKNFLIQDSDSQKIIIYQDDLNSDDVQNAEIRYPMIKYNNISEICKKIKPNSLSVVYYCDKLEDYRISIDEKDIEESMDDIKGVDPAYNTFDNISELHTQNNIKILAGKDFGMNDNKSALLESGVVYRMGYDDPKDIIGKSIEFISNEENLKVKIIGVYSVPELRKWSDGKNDYFYSEKEYKESCQSLELDTLNDDDIVVSMDVIQALNKNLSEDDFYSITITQDDVESIANTYEWLKQHYSNEIDCDIQSIYESVNYIRTFGIMFIIAGSVLALIAMTNIVSVVILTSESRKKWFAIQKVIGFSNQRLTVGYLMEIGQGLMRAITISISFVYIMGFFVSQIIYRAQEEESGVLIWFFPKIYATLETIGVVIVFVFGLSILIGKTIEKINIIDTLKDYS